MTALTSKLILAGIAFLIIFPSGYLLTRIGKPYNVVLITIHKLVGVGIGLYLVVTVIQQSQAIELGSTGSLSLISTGLFFLLLVISGSLLSAEREFPPVFKSLHRVLPYLAVLGSLTLLYLTF
jgi:hypothetical protein